MKALLIKDGTVVNAILVESIEAFQQESPTFFAEYDFVLEGSDVPGSPGIGWTYDGTDFTPPA